VAEHAGVAVGDALLWQRCTSSMAAGNGCSGARRYSGNSTRIPLARAGRRRRARTPASGWGRCPGRRASRPAPCRRSAPARFSGDPLDLDAQDGAAHDRSRSAAAVALGWRCSDPDWQAASQALDDPMGKLLVIRRLPEADEHLPKRQPRAAPT